MAYKEIVPTPVTKLEVGQSIEGTFVEIREGTYGPLYDIRCKDGEVKTLGSDTVLGTKLNKNLVGKKIKVELSSMEKSTQRKGKEYKNYKVFVEE